MKGPVIIVAIAAVLVLGLLFYFLAGSGDSASSVNADTNTGVNTPSSLNEGDDSTANTGNTAGSPNSHDIVIKGFAFSPKELRIKIGDVVTWSNMDSVGHTVTSDSGSELNSDLFTNGDSYSHVFNQAGTYTYHCKPHPNMKGKVIVR